jgi:prepilin-type processing-associated H-X9-DG protein
MLVALMAVPPSRLYSQPPASPATDTAGKPKPDLGYVTPDATAAMIAYPRHVLTAPEMEMLPIEVLSAAAKKELGIDPVEIEQVILIAEPPAGGPFQAALVLHFTSPIGEGKILAPLWDCTIAAELDGKSYRRGKGPMDPSIFSPDPRTLLVGTDDLLRRMVANHANPQPGKMSQTLGKLQTQPDVCALVLVEPLRPLASMVLAHAPLPPPLVDLKKMPELTSYVAAKVNLTGDGAASLVLRAQDEASADQIEQIFDSSLTTARQMMAAEIAKQADSSDPVEQAMAKYSKRMGERVLTLVRPVRKGTNFTLALPVGGQDSAQIKPVAVIGVLLGLLLPAVSSARGSARRAVSTNNTRQVMLAMHYHLSATGAFPARANFDKQGKPLLSWRVLMLPYLEQGNLYNQFHLDEPWDSEHNRKLIPLMPKVFRNPSGTAEQGKTPYLVVVGKGLMFEGNKGRRPADITDGMSHTIALVEVNDDAAVTWTKPDDWEYDANHPMAGLGRAHPGGFNAAFADGSVRFINSSIDPKIFHALLTIAGGEAVHPD